MDCKGHSAGLLSSVNNTGSTFSRLADVGITAQLGRRALSLNSTKLTAAFSDVENVQKLFTNFGGTDSTNGFGVRIKDFANGLLSASGAVTNKTNAVKKGDRQQRHRANQDQ